jgi:hypothetical protein
MKIPPVVAPVDYSTYSNEFVFRILTYDLYVNYETKRFTLSGHYMPENISGSINNISSYIDELEEIETFLSEWVSKACTWNKLKHRMNQDVIQRELIINNVSYKVEFNPQTSLVKIHMPSELIIGQRENFGIAFPHVTFINNGMLLASMKNYQIAKLSPDKKFVDSVDMMLFPLSVNLDPVLLNGYTYHMHYCFAHDVFYLSIPVRILEANINTLETELRELKYYFREAFMYSAIRTILSDGAPNVVEFQAEVYTD